jgi:hypothetical protein
MPSTVLVSGANISGLGHEQFRAVLNRLLTVEACLDKVPLADLDLSCRDHDPDGGIDADVKWPTGSKNEILRPGETVLQFKSGKITGPQLKREFSKPGVRKALRRGSRYILLVGHDYGKKGADQLRAKLSALCRERRISNKRCEIFFGSQIARWVSRHPSVVVMRELALGYPGFVTVEGWLRHPQLQNRWEPDDARAAIIERIRAFARRETQSYVMRIEGPAGVGKTRMTLEGLRHPGIEETAIYTLNAEESSVTELLGSIQGNVEAKALVVIDECDRDRQETLRSFADLSDGRLCLLCVGPADSLAQSIAVSPEVFVLKPLSESKIRDILKLAVGTITNEVSDVAVRLAGGYVKLALFIAFFVSRNKEIPAADLTKIDNVRTFLKRFVDAETRQALQLLSVLARVGWDDELKDEAEALAKHFDVSMANFKRGTKALRDRGVVVPRGRYLYVSPDLLAISAAADLWDEVGAELIEIVKTLPREGPRRELLRRLASMGSQPTVKKAVERLLGTEGLFNTLSDLDDSFRSEAFSILASALPDAAITVLGRIIDQSAPDSLADFKKGRRNAVWAIESLLRWPTTSLSAARSLMFLALSENETWGNNATGIFCEYFHVHLSRSPIPLTDRMVLVDELIRRNDSVSRLLAAKAAAAGLTRHEFRSGTNIDPFSGQPYPDEWRPRTWQELWTARAAAIERLNEIGKGGDEAAANARRDLVDGAFSLAADGMVKQTLQILEGVEPQTDKEKRRILDVARRLERDFKDRFSAEQIEELHRTADKCFDNSYAGRLKRWTGRHLHSDFNIEDPGAGDRAASDRIRALADDGYKNGISDVELGWLASPEAENAWVFGFRLGQIDENTSFLDRIVAVSPQNINALLFASYVIGHASVAGDDFRDKVLDGLRRTHPMLAFAGTWRGSGTRNGLDRVLGLVQSGDIPVETLGHLGWAGWTHSLSRDDVIRLVDSMLNYDAPELRDSISGILMNLLSREPESLRSAEKAVWRVIEIKPDRSWDWQWGQLASKMLHIDPRRVVSTVVSFFKDEDFVPISADETMKVLQTATSKDPASAWEVVGDAMLNDDRIGMRLLISLSGTYGDLIPTEMLLSWAKRNLPRGPWIVSRIISVRQSPLPERARALILSFPNDLRIKQQFAATLQSGFSVGPFSNRLTDDLSITEGWAKDSNPTIRSWASDLVRGIKTQLKRQKTLEEEQQF